ncbi:MAG TPA: hypothetical protein EYP19_10025, partial [Desulfobacterales bacterium]|nr:hypothetical protein [Desulfobacterales bacterium]
EEVLSTVESHGSQGLSAQEAEKRYRQNGSNILPETASRSRWDVFVNQFMSLPVGLSGIAATLSFVAGGAFDALVIMGVVAGIVSFGVII